MKRPGIFVCLFFGYAVILSTVSFGQTSFYKTYGHVTEGGEGRNIVQVADGGYFLTYYVYYAGHATACLAKLDCSGEKEWERFLGRNFNVLPVDIIPAGDLGCFVSVSAQVPGGIWRHYVIRYDAAGNQRWCRGYHMLAGNSHNCMAQAPDGNLFLCGGVDIAQTGKNGTCLVKLDTSGQTLWIRNFFDDHYQVPRALTVTSDGTVAVAGDISYSGFFFTDGFVFTCHADGRFLNRKIFSTTYDDEVTGISSDAQGTIYLTGYSYFITSAWDVFFHRFNRDLEWTGSRFYDGGTSQGEMARHIIHTTGNGIAIFGDEGGFNERNPMLIRLEDNGDLQWVKRYEVSPLFTNYAFFGSEAFDGGFLMTGDFRPPSQFRVAPVLKTTHTGESACYTAEMQLNAREDTVTLTDTLMQAAWVVDFIDTAAFPDPVFPMLTSVTTMCNNEKPCGYFSFDSDTLCPKSCFEFSSRVINSNNQEWYFEHGDISYYSGPEPPVICFEGKGPHLVRLLLHNDQGTVEYHNLVSGETDCPFLIPNLFTPGNDGLNDLFEVKGFQEDFSLRIFNRWGNLVFEAGVPGKWWDGTLKNGTGADEGHYFYILQVPGKNKAWTGMVYLKR